MTHHLPVCVALYYSTDIGESLRSRGFRTSETRLHAPMIENCRRTSSPGPPSYNLGVAASSPFTFTTSLPSSSTSNGPITTPLTTRGFGPGGSVVWASVTNSIFEHESICLDCSFVHHLHKWLLIRILINCVLMSSPIFCRHY